MLKSFPESWITIVRFRSVVNFICYNLLYDTHRISVRFDCVSRRNTFVKSRTTKERNLRGKSVESDTHECLKPIRIPACAPSVFILIKGNNLVIIEWKCEKFFCIHLIYPRRLCTHTCVVRHNVNNARCDSPPRVRNSSFSLTYISLTSCPRDAHVAGQFRGYIPRRFANLSRSFGLVFFLYICAQRLLIAL